MEIEKSYTPAEVAEMLGVSRQTVYNWITAGKLKAHKLGGTFRIKESDLKEFTGGNA